MKKAMSLGLMMLATLSLTGCEYIQNLIQGGEDIINEKKDYTYDDFAVLVASKNFTVKYKKGTATVEVDDEKSYIDYTYNAEDKKWHYEVVTTVADVEVKNDKTQELDVVGFLSDCKASAALIDKSVDSIYKFSADKKGYYITAHYKNSEKQFDGNYKFDTDGLFTLREETTTNLSTVKATTKKITYKYFE